MGLFIDWHDEEFPPWRQILNYVIRPREFVGAVQDLVWQARMRDPAYANHDAIQTWEFQQMLLAYDQARRRGIEKKAALREATKWMRA